MYLLEDSKEAKEMRENALSLLESDEVANKELALQIIKGGGVHTDFWALLWISAFMREEEIMTEENFKIAKKAFTILDNTIQITTQRAILLPTKDTGFTNRTKQFLISNFLEDKLEKFATIEGFEWGKLVKYFLPYLKNSLKKNKDKTIKRKYYRSFVDIFWQKSNLDKKTLLAISIENKEHLVLSYTNIKEIPEEIKYFPELKTIDIDDSLIEKFHDNFYQLPNLSYINYKKTPIGKGGKLLAELSVKMKAVASNILFNNTPLYDLNELIKEGNKEYKKLEKCLKINPNNINALHKKKDILEYGQKFDEALEIMLKIFEIDAKNSKIYYKCLQSFNKAKKYYEAIEFEKKFSDGIYQTMYNTDKSNCYFYLALAYYYTQQYEECILINQKSLACSNYAGTHFNIACAYANMPNQKQNMLTSLEQCFIMNGYKYPEKSKIDEDRDFVAYHNDEDFVNLIKKYIRYKSV
ncbi:MAG: hypothetical protein EAY69_05715 [Cytophagales bacterium]|nr:MAG: hypothetical protein EAY69_05715 [Cytophagales bacterium]